MGLTSGYWQYSKTCSEDGCGFLVQPIACADKYVRGWKEVEHRVTPMFCTRNHTKKVTLAEEKLLKS